VEAPNACASADAAESSEVPGDRFPKNASIDPPGVRMAAARSIAGATACGEDSATGVARAA
jgi:hypothetical protein